MHKTKQYYFISGLPRSGSTLLSSILKQKYGVWVSHNKEDVPLITSGSEENCIFSTRSYLKGLQEQNSLGITT